MRGSGRWKEPSEFPERALILQVLTPASLRETPDGKPRVLLKTCAVGTQARSWKSGGSPECRSSLEEARVRTGQVNSADKPLAEKDVGGRHLTHHVPLLDGSPQMRAIMRIVENVADTDATVLIRGESGGGTGLVARGIHGASGHRDGPFVKVNCAASPSGLLESELFGHEKGAFTGAHRRKLGQFECANNGTIYLDEIAELPLALQAKLLHVLQDFLFSRVGGDGLIDVTTRVIAATNRNVEHAMLRGEFREDLYYRRNVVELHVPPLRERKEEIPLLPCCFLSRLTEHYGRKKQLSPETMARLTEYP